MQLRACEEIVASVPRSRREAQSYKGTTSIAASNTFEGEIGIRSRFIHKLSGKALYF